MAKKKGEIKAFCSDLNSIVCIKRLTERQYKIVFNKLVRFVKELDIGQFSFSDYAMIVILNTLTTEEKKVFDTRIREVHRIKDEIDDPLLEYRVLGSYYSTVLEYYPELRIEYVCYEINEILPESVILDTILKESKESDENFRKKLEEKVAKSNKKKSANKYRLETIEDFVDLEKGLKKSIVGQDHAITSVCNSLKLKATDFSKHINLFFIGKTGRGKTQLARKLGERFSPNFWIINCGEYTNGHEVSRLLGSPPGYIGHSESSMVKDKAETSSKWTIVFDEIEKAHPKFFNIILNLLDTGIITDNTGIDADFGESIFVMTSNCGLSDLKTSMLGFDSKPSSEAHKEEIMKSLENTFSPEFRGRIDEFVFFNDLGAEEISKIAKLTLSSYPIKTTNEIISYVVRHGYTEEYGARDIQRVVKNLIALPLAEEILSNRHPDNGSGKYDLQVREDKVEIINTISL